MDEEEGSGADRAWLDRRRAMAALAAAGGGFALLGGRWPSLSHTGERLIPWPTMSSMTVRFPVVVEASEVVSGGGTRLDRVEVPGVVDHGLLLGLLPRDRLISWTLDGVRTRRPRVEVVRMLRQRIVDDFSNGRCLLARGWILSETEWCLLHLSSIRPAGTR